MKKKTTLKWQSKCHKRFEYDQGLSYTYMNVKKVKTSDRDICVNAKKMMMKISFIPF